VFDALSYAPVAEAGSSDGATQLVTDSARAGAESGTRVPVASLVGMDSLESLSAAALTTVVKAPRTSVVREDVMPSLDPVWNIRVAGIQPQATACLVDTGYLVTAAPAGGGAQLPDKVIIRSAVAPAAGFTLNTAATSKLTRWMLKYDPGTYTLLGTGVVYRGQLTIAGGAAAIAALYSGTLARDENDQNDINPTYFSPGLPCFLSGIARGVQCAGALFVSEGITVVVERATPDVLATAAATSYVFSAGAASLFAPEDTPWKNAAVVGAARIIS